MFARAIVLVAVVAVIARRSDGAGNGAVYVVRQSDTLWSIAASHYSGDPREGVWKLEDRNHLRETVLRPGQRLILP